MILGEAEENRLPNTNIVSDLALHLGPRGCSFPYCCLFPFIFILEGQLIKGNTSR